MSTDPFQPQPFHPEDVQLLQSLKGGGLWLRSVLCTLARLGVLLRQISPERAKAILDSLATFPYYKAGQFLFDLLELEDFMMDGPPPDILPAALDAGALQRLASTLNAVKRSLDGQAAIETTGMLEIEGGRVIGELPPLEGGFYLYQDVVLGVWSSASELGKSKTPK